MRKVGMIGLGTMGFGMADNLLKAGFCVKVWNRTKEKAMPLVEKGATLVSEPYEVAIDTDAVITMLSADEQVKDILLGTYNLIAHATKDQLFIDSSTVSAATSRELFERFKEKGAHFLDAPVTGSKPQANDGTLGFIVGGNKDIFDRAEKLFAAMGKTAVYMGESGSGSTAKLISNAMVSISLLALSEGLAMAKKSNLHLHSFLDIVAAGGANSRMVEMKADKLLTGDYSAQFSSALMNKDLHLASDLSDNLQVTTPILSMAKQLFQTTVNKGYAEDDLSAVFKLYEEWGNINK